MRNKFILITAAVMALASLSCVRPEYRRTEGAVWGTTYHITYNSDKNLDDSIISEMKKVEESLSMFDKNSTVSRINRRETSEADDMFLSVLYLSKKVNKASNGAFDPTVAPLVDAWGFGRKGRESAIPDTATISAIMKYVGFDKVVVSNRQLTMPEGMELDFSAIAKGFGVDCIADMLARNQCSDFMVEIGGEVSVSGLNPDGNEWRIMIESPFDMRQKRDSGMDVLNLKDCAVATSGNYRNYRNISADSVIGHTINPKTGFPKKTVVLSATVIAPTCALADALATALMVADTVEASHIVKSFPRTRAILYCAGKNGIEAKVI